MTTQRPQIQFVDDYDSVIYLVTEDVREGDDVGTLALGDRVFFRRAGDYGKEEDDGSVTMMYDTGEPTNGTEYVTFEDDADAATMLDYLAPDVTDEQIRALRAEALITPTTSRS